MLSRIAQELNSITLFFSTFSGTIEPQCLRKKYSENGLCSKMASIFILASR